jgi:hypothetical protein
MIEVAVLPSTENSNRSGQRMLRLIGRQSGYCDESQDLRGKLQRHDHWPAACNYSLR